MGRERLTVTVVRSSEHDLSIKINANYGLGSIAGYGQQIYQARIPLLAFPETRAFFSWAWAPASRPARRSAAMPTGTSAESLPASSLPTWWPRRKKTSPGGRENSIPRAGSYRDPRARVVIGDGRNHLLASRERYSMVNADLFLPYRRGTGNLYSREHFQIVRERLEPGGVFVQWLPLYQMTEREFGVIAKTMLAVFPQVSLWRGNFQPGAEIAAIVGHVDGSPLPACSLDMDREKKQAVEGATHRTLHDVMLPINEQTVLLF